MNRRLAIPFLTAVAGIAAGWLAGTSIPRDAMDPAKTAADNSGNRAPSRHRTPSSTSPTQPLDFASYVKRVARPAEKEEAEEAAARMSNQELRELLLSLPLIEWEKGVSKQDFVLYRASDAIAAELFRREGSAAIDWVASTGKQPAFAALLRALCAVDPNSAKPYLTTFHTTFQYNNGWEFPSAGVHAAALRGAGALLEVQKIWDSSGMDSIPAFAADFDFAGYFAKVDQSHISALPLVAWVGRDPEAAAAAIARGLQTGPWWDHVLGRALESRAQMAGEAEAARWVVPLLNAGSGETRESAFRQVTANNISSVRAQALMNALGDDHDRVLLAQSSMRMDNSGGRYSLRVLQALPSEELKVQALSQALSGKGPRSFAGTRQGALAYLEKFAPKLGLSEASRQRVLAALPAE